MKLHTLITITSLIGVVLFYFQKERILNVAKSNIETCKKQQEDLYESNKSFVELQKQGIKFDGLTFDKTLPLYSGQGYQERSYDLQKSGGHNLVVVFNRMQCDACIDKISQKLDELIQIDSSLKKHIFILGGFDDGISLARYKKAKKISIPIYRFNLNDLKFSFKDFAKPCIFMLTENSSIYNFYMPDIFFQNKGGVLESYLAKVRTIGK